MTIKQTLQKLFQILSKKDRKHGIQLLFLVSVMGILEAVGIASIMPFLAIIGNPEIVQENQILNNVYQFFHSNWAWVTSVDQFLILLGLMSFIFTLTVAFFRIFTLFKMNKYIEICRHHLSKNILEVYLNQSYEFFLNRHSAELTKNMLSEVDQVVIEVLRPVIQMISYILVLLAIMILLMWNNPSLAISTIVVMGLLYLGVYYSLRRRLAFYGDLSVQSNKERFKSAIEAIGGIKSIKLFAVEKIYIDSFDKFSSNFTKSLFHYQIYNQTPKHLLEAIAFGGIIMLTVVMLWKSGGTAGNGLGELLPLLGLYAFSAYRAQPALTAIYQGITGLRYGTASVDNLFHELNSNNPQKQLFMGKDKLEVIEFGDIILKHYPKSSGLSDSPRIKPCSVIKLEGINYKFPNAEKFVINNINLKIQVGSCVGIIGGSGAGKTTLLDIILGLLKPTNGFIVVDDIRIDAKNYSNWQKCLGYVPQEMFLTDASIGENIAFGVPINKIDHNQVIKCAKMAQIHDFIKSDLNEGYDTKVGERGVRLSGGQRQRISIARALYNNPDVLIFDEATSALDPITEKSVIQTISSLSGTKTVIIVAHKLTAVKYCDSIVLLDRGRIETVGTISEVEKLHKDFFS